MAIASVSCRLEAKGQAGRQARVNLTSCVRASFLSREEKMKEKKKKTRAPEPLLTGS